MTGNFPWNLDHWHLDTWWGLYLSGYVSQGFPDKVSIWIETEESRVPWPMKRASSQIRAEAEDKKRQRSGAGLFSPDLDWSGSPDLPPELTELAFHIPTGCSGFPACWLPTVGLLQRPVPQEKSLICHWLFLQRMWAPMLHGQGADPHVTSSLGVQSLHLPHEARLSRTHDALIGFFWLANLQRNTQRGTLSKRLSLAFPIRAQGQRVPMWSSSPQISHREGIARNYSRNEQADLLIQSEAAS